MKWLLQEDVFGEDEYPLMEALDRSKTPYQIVGKGRPLFEVIDEIDYDTTQKYLFRGSLNFASMISKRSDNCRVYCYLPHYECSFYYPKFGFRLLNENYVMLPLGDLNRRREDLFDLYGQNDELFIRPNSGAKPFTGEVVTKSDFYRKVRSFESMAFDSTDLVVVSSPKTILKEWRFIVAIDSVITGGQYKEDGEDVRKQGLPASALSFVQDAIEDSSYCPDDLWTIDVCLLGNGQYKIVEANSFSCAGLYACDYDAIVAAV